MTSTAQQSSTAGGGPTASASRYAVVLYEFLGSIEKKTLTIHPGDLVKLVAITESQWWFAEFEGRAGYVPREFFTLKPEGWAPGLTGATEEGKDDDTDEEEDEEEDGKKASASPSPDSASRALPVASYVAAVALHSFEKTHPRHVAMTKRDRILVIPPKDSTAGEGWLEAKVGDDTGIVPSNRVYILLPGEVEPPQWRDQRQKQLRLGGSKDFASFDSTVTTSTAAAKSLRAATEAPIKSSEIPPPPPMEEAQSSAAAAASAKRSSQITDSIRQKAICIMDYRAVAPRELTVTKGDVLEVEPSEQSEWWPARKDKTGESGLVQKRCIRVETDGLPPNPFRNKVTGNTSISKLSVMQNSSSLREVPGFAAIFAMKGGVPENARYDRAETIGPEEDALPPPPPSEESNNPTGALTRPHSGSVMSKFVRGIKGRGAAPSVVSRPLAEKSAKPVPAAWRYVPLADHEVNEFNEHVRFVFLSEGATLFQEGAEDEATRCMYCVLEGQLEVTLDGDAFGTIGPGHSFGLEMLLDPDAGKRPCTMSVPKSHPTPVILACLSYHSYKTLCKSLFWFEDAVRGVVAARSGANLSQIALFHKLDPSKLSALGLLMKYRVLKKGETFTPQTLSIVVVGSASVTIVFSDGTKRELRRVGVGSFFGEHHLVPSVEAKGAAHALEQSTVVLELTPEYASLYAQVVDFRVTNELSQIARFRTADTVSQITSLQSVPAAKRGALAAAFDFLVVPAGEEVTHHCKCLYVVCDGLVEVRDAERSGGGEIVRLIRPGMWFGEKSLIPSGLATSFSASPGGASSSPSASSKSGPTAIDASSSLASLSYHVSASGSCVLVALHPMGLERFLETAPEIRPQVRAALEASTTDLVQAVSPTPTLIANPTVVALTNAQGMPVAADTSALPPGSRIPTSPDDLACASLVSAEYMKSEESKAALVSFDEVGKCMAPCLANLIGHPQHMHPEPFDIGRNVLKLFNVSIVRVDDKMDSIIVETKLSSTVGDLVASVFKTYAASYRDTPLDPAGPECFGLKVAGRADYLIDRDVELGRYKCVTSALRRGLDKGELRFALVDLRVNPRSGPGLRVRPSSPVKLGRVALGGDDCLMEAVAIYDYDGGPGQIAFRAGDRLEVEVKLGEPTWSSVLISSTMMKSSKSAYSQNRTVSGPVPQNVLKALTPIVGPVTRQRGATVVTKTDPLSSKVPLPGAPPLTLEEWARFIAEGADAAERIPPPWGVDSIYAPVSSPNINIPMNPMAVNSSCPWPLRLRLRGAERLFSLYEIERCGTLQFRVELVFGGQVLETRLTRPFKRASVVRFEDDWIYFTRFVSDLNVATRVTVTLLGLDVAPAAPGTNARAERDSTLPDGGESGEGGGSSSLATSLGGPRRMDSALSQMSDSPSRLMTGSGSRGTLVAANKSGASGASVARAFFKRKVASSSANGAKSPEAPLGSLPKDGASLEPQVLSSSTEVLDLAGVAFQIWGHDLHAKSGLHTMGMWPGRMGERVLYCLENHDGDAPKISVEMDSYSVPLRYDMPKAVELRRGDASSPKARAAPTVAPLAKKSTGGPPAAGGKSTMAERANRRKSVSVFQAAQTRAALDSVASPGATSASTSSSSSAAPKPQVSKSVQQLLKRDPLQLYKMSDSDKSLIWAERELLKDNPYALTKVMLAVNWHNPNQRNQALELLSQWAAPSPMQALELLDGRFGDYRLREYAVACLEAFDDNELCDFILQATQCLKYEIFHDSPIARFLLRRSLANPREIGNRFFWGLRAEMHVKRFAPRFGLLLKAYLRSCGAHFAELSMQHDAQELMRHVARSAQQIKNASKSERTAHARASVAQMNERMPRSFHLPIDSRMKAVRFNPDGCRIMSSKKKPLWLELESVDPVEAGGEPMLVMFKVGDDLRQDQMALQVLRFMEGTWIAEGMNLKLTPYACLATGDEMGMLEIVPNSRTIAMIEIAHGGMWGSMKRAPIRDFLQGKNPGANQLESAVETFIASCAGYCVFTYVLGIGDRHNDNIMLTSTGKLFHIDFGHVLGNFKTVAALGGFKRERTPFVFTRGMAYAMGGKQSDEYKRFVELCKKAFNVIRLHGDELVTLLRLMVPAGMPELQSDEDIAYLVEMLHLGLSDAEAGSKFAKEIDAAVNDTYRRIDNWLHTMKHG